MVTAHAQLELLLERKIKISCLQHSHNLVLNQAAGGNFTARYLLIIIQFKSKSERCRLSVPHRFTFDASIAALVPSN